MSEIIDKGYLISIKDYQENDHIINFIFSDGNIHGMLSKGSRKLLSKNGRHLLMGSLLETEYFGSRRIEKLSLLKRVKSINPITLMESNNQTITFLNDYLMKNQINKFNFKFYEEIINAALKDDLITSIIICLKILIDEQGLLINLDKCLLCSKEKIYSLSFKLRGFVCNICYNIDEDLKTPKQFNKSLYYVNKKRFDSLKIIDNDIKFKIAKFYANYLYDYNGTYCDLNYFKEI